MLSQPDAFIHRNFDTQMSQMVLQRQTATQIMFCTQTNFTHRNFQTEKPVQRTIFTRRNFYTWKLLHRETVTRNNFYTQTLWHRQAVTQRNRYREKFIHNRTCLNRRTTFTQKLLQREKPSHRAVLTQRNIYKEKPLHRAAFKQRKRRATITQRNFGTDRAAFARPTILTKKLLQKGCIFYTETSCREIFFYTKRVLHREFFTHSSSYTQTLVHIEILIRRNFWFFTHAHTYLSYFLILRRETFTHRCVYIQYRLFYAKMLLHRKTCTHTDG